MIDTVALAKAVDPNGDLKVKLTRHFMDISQPARLRLRVLRDKVGLKQLKNKQAPSYDGITSELLEAGKLALKALQRFFNFVLVRRYNASSNKSVVVWFLRRVIIPY